MKELDISNIIEIKTEDFELRVKGITVTASIADGDKSPPTTIEMLASQVSVLEVVNPWYIIRVLAEELAKK